MPPADSLSIPRATYGLWMALATVCALGVTAVSAWALGGNPTVVQTAVGILAIGSLFTFGPALFRVSREHWGVVVLFCGVARAFVAIGAGFLVGRQDPSLTPRAFFLGIAAGAILLLVVETALAITILSRIERRRETLKAGAPQSPNVPSPQV